MHRARALAWTWFRLYFPSPYRATLVNRGLLQQHHATDQFQSIHQLILANIYKTHTKIVRKTNESISKWNRSWNKSLYRKSCKLKKTHRTLSTKNNKKKKKCRKPLFLYLSFLSLHKLKWGFYLFFSTIWLDFPLCFWCFSFLVLNEKVKFSKAIYFLLIKFFFKDHQIEFLSIFQAFLPFPFFFSIQEQSTNYIKILW